MAYVQRTPSYPTRRGRRPPPVPAPGRRRRPLPAGQRPDGGCGARPPAAPGRAVRRARRPVPLPGSRVAELRSALPRGRSDGGRADRRHRARLRRGGGRRRAGGTSASSCGWSRCPSRRRRTWRPGRHGRWRRCRPRSRSTSSCPAWPAGERALERLGAAGRGAKLRTGGLRAELFPSAGELAAFLTACAELQVPFKCTAGLHHAVHHTDPTTGFVHHGFLNLVVATARAIRGGDVERRPGRGATRARRRRSRGHRPAGGHGDQSAVRQLRVLRRRGAGGRPPRARAADCSMTVAVT